MAIQQPFQPSYDTGISATVGTTSSSLTLPLGSVSVCITSINNVLCYVRIGKSSVTASIKDYPVPPNQQVVITKDSEDTTIAFIAPAGGGNLHIIVGNGY